MTETSVDVSVLVSRRPPTPSRVYDTYWRFAALRQDAYFSRLTRWYPPWTTDPVIGDHRFTNAYRAADRVSQYLIQHVIGQNSRSIEDTVLRILLFKVFNKVETWTLLEAAAGDLNESTFDVEHLDQVLSEAMAKNRRVYSAAYIMPVAAEYAEGRKHKSHLRMLAAMLEDRLPERLTEAQRMADAYNLLLEYSGIGPFLAFQYVIDLNYAEAFDYDEMEFVMPGPGCRSGLRKCFSDPGDYSDEDLIRFVCDRQEMEFENRGLTFRNLFGRRLQLIDCQNLFCEVDKYSRVAHPDVGGLAGRTRIKQKYIPSGPIPRPWFPPKWNINDEVGRVLEGPR